jgi:type VI secretion system protein ImpH
MAATSGEPAASLVERLYAEGCAFDFFQAVRLLEKMAPERQPVGHEGPPSAEAARFRAHIALNFSASAIYEVEPPSAPERPSIMTVTFMGLTGPNGVLPRHYTEMHMRAGDVRGPERYVARDWFDLFNHRLLSLFYRAWTKYRFWLAYERGEYAEADPDIYTESLYSLIGLGGRSLRNRLFVAERGAAHEVSGRGAAREVSGVSTGARRAAHEASRAASSAAPRTLARVDDLALIYYAGLLSHRPRCAISLERLLEDFFGIPIRVLEFQGQWLQLDPANQTQVGAKAANALMGLNVVVGDRVWDVRGKIRIRLGPLTYKQFASFLPDQSPVTQRKEFFRLMHLVRLYIGPELKVAVQLILKASEIPPCRSGRKGARLGWDSWVTSRPMRRDSEDAVFDGVEISWLTDANGKVQV